MAQSNDNALGRLPSLSEQTLCNSLHLILNGTPSDERLLDSALLREMLAALEHFIPEVLREFYPAWNHESLDGVLPITAEKIADRTICIFGQCILISDQSLTPIHVEMQVDSAGDRFSWFFCTLGVNGRNGMVRTPYVDFNSALKLTLSLEDRKVSIDWTYKITFGKRLV